MYYVYILRLNNHQLYAGRTDNLRRRIHEHKIGKVKATQGRTPIQLVFYEAFTAKSDAIRRERYFKTNKGKTTLRLMLRNFLLA